MAGREAKKKADARRKRPGRRGQRGTRTTPKFKLVLKLGETETAVVSFEQLIQLYADGKIREKKFKGLCYSLSVFVQYLRLKKQSEIEEKILKLEKLIEEAIQR